MILLKFNLIFVPLLLLSAAATGFLVREQLRTVAEDQVLQNARFMLQTASATRVYTTKQIAPLLEHERFKVDRTVDALQQTLDRHLPAAFQVAAEHAPKPKDKQFVNGVEQQVLGTVRQQPRELPETEFHPQSVPAYAATEVFNYFKAKYPEYTYKEATLNPTNLRDRTVDWEADVVNAFRNAVDRTEVVGRRQTATGPALFLSIPLKVNNSSCLTCHSTPDKAPPEMIKLYGSANGFGWKLDEVIGAQIVSVPASLPDTIAGRTFVQLLWWLGPVFGGFWLLLNLAFLVLTRRPAVVPAALDQGTHPG